MPSVKRTMFLGISVLLLFLCICLRLLLLVPNRTLINSKTRTKLANQRLIRLAQDPAFNLDLNVTKKVIILLSSFRTGSTFLGQLFNNNPRMQYIFEPFHDGVMRTLYERGNLVGARADHTYSDLRMLYLQQIMHNCSLWKTPFSVKFEFCGTPQENMARFNSTKCDVSKVEDGVTHQQVCRYRDILVIKVIRLQDLGDIMKIAQIKSANIKIIHLLRHPIPMMMSRLMGGRAFYWRKYKKFEFFENELSERRFTKAWETYNYCFENMKSIRFVHNSDWLRNNYMSVTHRQLSLDSIGTAEKVYQFVNEMLVDDIKDFMHNITSQLVKGPLSSYRISADIVDAWRTLASKRLKFWDIQSMSQQCKLLLEKMDEKFVLDDISNKFPVKLQSEF